MTQQTARRATDQSLHSYLRLSHQAARTHGDAARWLAYAREVCPHAHPVCCLGIVLCPACGASWGGEDPIARRASPVDAQTFAQLDREIP